MKVDNQGDLVKVTITLRQLNVIIDTMTSSAVPMDKEQEVFEIVQKLRSTLSASS